MSSRAGRDPIVLIEIDDDRWDRHEEGRFVDPYCTRAFQMAQAGALAQRPVLVAAAGDGWDATYVLLLYRDTAGNLFARTPEYGGPSLRLEVGGPPPAACLRVFRTRIDEALRELGVVSEFISVSAWLPFREDTVTEWAAAAEKDLCVSELRSADQRWASLRKGRRSDIRKAEREYEFSWSPLGMEQAEEFAVHYSDAMDAKDASLWWRFSSEYFVSLAMQPGLAIDISIARNASGGAAALFLSTGESSAYLYATRWGVSGGAPSLVLWNAEDALRASSTSLLLGGGVSTDPNDSLFTFKKSLSDGVIPHYVAARVFDREAHRVAADGGEARPLPLWSVDV